MSKLRELYHGLYHRWGNSYGITIPPDIRAEMKLLPGDHIIMNYSHGMLWVAKINKDIIMPREAVSAIFDKLFPDKEDKNGTD